LVQQNQKAMSAKDEQIQNLKKIGNEFKSKISQLQNQEEKNKSEFHQKENEYKNHSLEKDQQIQILQVQNNQLNVDCQKQIEQLKIGNQVLLKENQNIKEKIYLLEQEIDYYKEQYTLVSSEIGHHEKGAKYADFNQRISFEDNQEEDTSVCAVQ
jgi:hypothetical protein